MTKSETMWAPFRGLSVKVDPSRGKVGWREFLDLLKHKVRHLAKQEDRPVDRILAAWEAKVGSDLDLKNPEDLVDQEEFQAILRETTGLSQSKFPLAINQADLTAEADPQTIEDWLQVVL